LMFREQEKLQLLKRFRQSVGPDVPWVGFYTIGEIAPVEEHNGINRFASIILALS
jgi:small ligand-binding sensory domain FIST